MKKTKKLLEEYLRKEEMESNNKEVIEKGYSPDCFLQYHEYEEALKNCLRKVVLDLVDDYADQFSEQWGEMKRTMDSEYFLRNAKISDGSDLSYWCKEEDFQKFVFDYVRASISEEDN